MSLQVWLPLNGSLRNQGVRPFSQATEWSTPTYVNGKIGKAISTGSFCIPAAEAAKFYNNDAMSFCFWIYPTAESGYSCLLGQESMNVGDNRMFTIFQYPSPLDLHLSWQSNESNDVFFSSVDYNVFALNTWTHCAVTYNGSEVCIYINGSLYVKRECNKSPRTDFNYNVPVHSSSTRYLNDLRIYDHCLSANEVKEISRGLIVHYPFSDPYVEQTINIDPTKDSGPDFSWTQTKERVVKDGVECWHYILTGSSEGWFGCYSSANGFEEDTILTRSCLLYIPSGQNTNGWYGLPFSFENMKEVLSSRTYDYSKPDTWQQCYCTGKSAGTNSNFLIYMVAGSNSSFRLEFYIANIQLEAKDHPTPFVSSSRSNIVIRDCSGFKNDGEVINSMSVSNDTPRDVRCTDFGSSTTDYYGHNGAVRTPLELIGCNACTIAFWAKPIGVHTLFCLSSDSGAGGYTSNILQHFDGNIFFGYGSGRNVEFSPIYNSWHHYTLVYNGTSLRLYFDGVLNKEVTFSNLVMDNVYYLFVNFCYAGGVNRKSATKMSDFRLFVTALSEDSIKELYNTSAFVNKNGNLLTYHFDEGDAGVDITKSGIVKALNLSEYKGGTKILSDGSVWVKILHHNNPTSYLFTESNCWNNDSENLFSALGILKTDGWANNAGEYEFLVCEKLTSSSSEAQYRWKQTSNPSLSSSVTGYTVLSGSPISGGLLTNGSYGAMHNGSTWWCCCGSYTPYDGGIPGFGGTVTTGYLDLYVRVPNEKMLDEERTIFHSSGIQSNELIEI